MAKKNKDGEKKQRNEELDFSQLIKQSLQVLYGATEEQIDIIDHVLAGEMPTEDAEFALHMEETKDSFRPPPGLVVDMGNGTSQTLTITNHPLNRMYGYLVEKYGEKFGTLYWSALTSIGKPGDYYELLQHFEDESFFE